jgi:hypothetical protein
VMEITMRAAMSGPVAPKIPSGKNPHVTAYCVDIDPHKPCMYE